MIQKTYHPAPDQGGGSAVADAPPAAAPSPISAPMPSTSPDSTPPPSQNTGSSINPPPNAPVHQQGGDRDGDRDAALKAAFDKAEGKVPMQKPQAPPQEPEAVKQVDQPEQQPEAQPEAAPTGDELDQLDKLPAPQAPNRANQGKYDSDWNAIKEKYSNLVRAERARSMKQREEYDGKLATLTQQLKDIESKAQTLEGYRAAIDLQSDPTFIEKYEKPIADKKAEMTSYLKSIGVPDDAINSLNNVWSDDYSLRKITKQLEDQDAVVGETFREHVVELRRLQKDHQKMVREANTKRDQLIKESREGMNRKQTEREASLKQRFDEVLKMRVGDGPSAIPKFGFMTEIAIPPNASPEQKALLEKHNAKAIEEQQQIQQLSRSDDPAERVDQAVLSRMFPILLENYNKMKANADAMDKELRAIKKSSSFSAPTAAPSKTAAPSPRKVDASMDGGQAIDAMFGVRG